MFDGTVVTSGMNKRRMRLKFDYVNEEFRVNIEKYAMVNKYI